MSITSAKLEEVAYELNRRAAIAVPLDATQAFEQAARRETNALAKRVLLSIVENAGAAIADGRAMCGDTGLPRFYVKAGNHVQLEDGFVALEGALRRATARATQDVKLRSNRVHPLTRRNPGNNVGVFAPNIDYRFEPGGDWIDITAVHKGGLFGSDYRMLFPGDGVPGIKRFFVDTIAEFNRRGLSCPPLIMGVGLGGTKDQCFTLSKEAACLRLVGDRHPDPAVAQLEEELLELGNKTMLGVMGLRSDTPVLDVHCEIAYAHTGGLPVAISELCHAVRRATARIYNDGRVAFRQDPQWFTEYMRREGVDAEDLTPGSVPEEKGTASRSSRQEIPLTEIPWQNQPAQGLTASLPAAVPERAPEDVRDPAPPGLAPAPRAGSAEPREVHLHIPLSEADVRQLRAGDIVYLSGGIFTARDGVYDYMLRQGHEPPIDIKNDYNVTTQSSPAGAEVAPGRFEVTSLQATAGFRYAQWMEPLCARYGVRAVIGKGGMSEAVYQNVFKKYGVVCLSTMGYGIGALYGRTVKQVKDVIWKQELGISEAMWLLEVEEMGPLLVEGDTEGNSFFSQHTAEVNEPLLAAYEGLPDLILSRLGEVTDPTKEMIG